MDGNEERRPTVSIIFGTQKISFAGLGGAKKQQK
jgi:hypothetical protein